MTVRKITPQGVTTLFAPASPTHTGMEPGSHLRSYPEGAARGAEAKKASALEEDGRIIVLSEPIPAGQLDPTTPYVLQDTNGRVLCVNGAGSGGWQWAYVGEYGTYAKDVMPLFFSANPTTRGATLSVRNGSSTWPLYSNGNAASWEWTFWAPPGYRSGSYPVMSINALIEKHNPDRYKLTWNNDGTQMNLCADTGSWNWLYVSSTASATLFTIHKFYVLKSKIDQLFRRTWPSASIIGSQFKTGDAYYEAVSDAQARAIYNNSGLSAYVWTPEVFDCDDFSYVYKAQASRDAYASKAEYGYAVGVIFGKSPSGAHAVNVFIDTNATVRILDPQNGSIVAGKDWKDQEGEAYEPYFVLM